MAKERSIRRRFRHKVRLSVLMLGVGIGLIFSIAIFKTVFAVGAQEAVARAPEAKVICWAFFSASICVGISALAAGIAVAYVGAAALGAISEKPELVGRSLIFVGLAEGIAIYGLIIAIMILARVG